MLFSSSCNLLSVRIKHRFLIEKARQCKKMGLSCWCCGYKFVGAFNKINVILQKTETLDNNHATKQKQTNNSSHNIRKHPKIGRVEGCLSFHCLAIHVLYVLLIYYCNHLDLLNPVHHSCFQHMNNSRSPAAIGCSLR